MMTRASFEQGLQTLLKRQPFQPFIIEFDDGERWVVGEPAALWYQEGRTAVYSRPDGSLHFVDCEAVRQFVELTPAGSP